MPGTNADVRGLGGFVWSIAEILRGDFKQPESSAVLPRVSELREKVLLHAERLREFRSALITAAVTGQFDFEAWGRRGETHRRLDKIEEDMAEPSTAGQVEARA